MYSSSATLQLTNCTVSGNASAGDGGGLYTVSGTVSVVGGSVEQNDASGYGGAWYVEGGSPLLQSSQMLCQRSHRSCRDVRRRH